MRKLIALLVLLLAAIPAQAQTATPTVSPSVHVQGEYWFASDPFITWSGVWTSPANGFLTFRQTASNAAYAAFTVSDEICFVSVAPQMSTTTSIQIEAVTANFLTTFAATGGTGNTPTIGFPIVLNTTVVNQDFVIRIYFTNTTIGALYRFQLLECPDNTPVPTGTILPSSTPFVPVPTATILPSSTPFVPVPTATILPSSTPFVPVPTATILPSSTPFAGIDIQPTIDALLTLIAGGGGCGCGPTDTPTITNTPGPTETPTPAPWAYITLTSGQLTRFDYVATASDVHIANLITAVLFSLWGMFLFGTFVVWKAKK